MQAKNLFVYGTLRKDAGSETAHLLKQYAEFIGEGVCRGRLYKIKDYPGIVPSENPADQVRGEVFRLREPEIILPRLDQYEECGPAFPEPAEYVREEQEVRLENGEKLLAWVYVYNRPVDGLERIASGDFMKP